MADDQKHVLRNSDVSHERSDLNMRVLAATVVGTFVGTMLVVGLLWFLFQHLRSEYDSIADVFGIPERFTTMEEPILQRAPTRDLAELNQEQRQKLHSYTWTDREQGLVSIPIERAMLLVLKNGLPPADPMPDLKLGIPSTGHRQTGFDPMVILPEEAR